MIQYASIPEIRKGVVFSDPLYDETVWCQYRKDFTDSSWLMKMDSRIEDGILDFEMYLGRPTVVGSVRLSAGDDGEQSIFYPARFDVREVELGIDTAAIFCGQRENWDEFAREAAIYTGADGMFGYLQIFTCIGENDPAGFLLLGVVDASLLDEPTLFQQFCAGFNGERINEQEFAAKTDLTSFVNKIRISEELGHFEAAVPDRTHHPDKGETER